MNRTLLEELIRYFSEIEAPNELEKLLLLHLEGELPFFKITSVSREDLEEAGFDVSKVSDAKMCTLAGKLADDYYDQLFWSSLSIIAEGNLKIPRKNNLACPFCDADLIKYDVLGNSYCCAQCQSEWSDLFVLVEYPEDARYFEQEGIGYPCFNSEDNGAFYIPDYDYIRHYKKHPRKEKYFNPVSWPDSQKYMDNPLCEAIIADEKGLEEFGACSYWVPLLLSQSKK